MGPRMKSQRGSSFPFYGLSCLVLWIFFSMELSISAVAEDLCSVTELQAYLDIKKSSAVYTAIVRNETACRGKKLLCPGDTRRYGKVAFMDATNGRNITFFLLRVTGEKCHPKKKSIQFACGNLVSNIVYLPGVSIKPKLTYYQLNNFTFTLTIAEHPQTSGFDIRVYRGGKIIADKKDVKGGIPANITGDFCPATDLQLKIYPILHTKDPDCIAPIVSVGNFKLSCVGPETTIQSQYDYRWIIVVSPTSGILVVAGIAYLYRKSRNWRRLSSMQNIDQEIRTTLPIAQHQVLIVHTKESPALAKEVEKLSKLIKETRKVYDICGITSQEVLSDPRSWLLSEIGLKGHTSVVLVFSPGLYEMLKTIKKGTFLPGTIDLLGRGHLPSDCLLLNFFQYLYEISYDYDYQRFIAVEFENPEHIRTDHPAWLKVMKEAGIPHIGQSRTFSLPSDESALRKALH